MNQKVHEITIESPIEVFGHEHVVHARYTGNPIIYVNNSKTQQGAVYITPVDNFEKKAKFFLSLVKEKLQWTKESQSIHVKVLCYEQMKSEIDHFFADKNVEEIKFVYPEKCLDTYFYADSNRLRVMETSDPLLIPYIAKEKKHSVFIVDDSKTMRALLKKIISSHPHIQVIGEAGTPHEALSEIERLQPDILTLDINLPEMSGVDLLKLILDKQFIPAVMISALGINEGYEVLRAIELGAVDYMQKPTSEELSSMTATIHEKLLHAAQLKRKTKKAPSTKSKKSIINSKTGLVAIGSSTGGTVAIKDLFSMLPKEIPPIVVVQHIPPHFSTAFANSLSKICSFEVREAKDGDEVLPGLALIAPGGFHTEVVSKKGKLFIKVSDYEPVNRFKPSVDVLFFSVAREVGANATGIILTGMGNDGARGLLQMKQAGAYTIAQDEESSVVFGMPKAAIEMGAATDVLSLDEIPQVGIKKAA